MNNVRRNVESYNEETDSSTGTNTLLITCLPACSRSIEKAVSPMKECFFNSSLFIIRNSERTWTVSGSRPWRRENIQAGWVAAHGILLAARSDTVSIGGPNLWNNAAMGLSCSPFRSLTINGDVSRKRRTLQNSYKDTVQENKYSFSDNAIPYTFFHASTALVGQGLLIVEVSRSHSDTRCSVGLLWTSDRPVAGTSAWQHTTLTTDKTSMSPAGFEPTLAARERSQSHALDLAATRTAIPFN